MLNPIDGFSGYPWRNHATSNGDGLCCGRRECRLCWGRIYSSTASSRISHYLTLALILILCSSPFTEDVTPRSDRSVHGVPPSGNGLVTLQNVHTLC